MTSFSSPESFRSTPREPGDVLPLADATTRIVEADRREEAELGRKLTIVVFVRAMLITLALAVLVVFAQIRWLGSHAGFWLYALVGLTYGLTLSYAGLLRLGRGLLLLAYTQIVIDTGIVSFLVLLTGGVESVFTFVYVFTVLGASITLYRRGALVAALSYFLMFGTIVLLQVDSRLGLMTEVDFGHAIFSLVMHASSIVLVGVLSAMLSEKLRITGRRLAEKQSDYERLEVLHAAILRSLPAGLLTIDPDGVIRYANEASLGILRASFADILGRPLGEVVPCMASPWEEARGPEGLADERWARQRREANHHRRDGRPVRLGFSFAPLGGKEGVHWGSIAVFQDVTEIVRLKEAYERAERLATVGKMAAGLAHEVRNPLASVCASIDVLKQTLDPPDSMKRLMTNIVREADRLNSLISDFLEFARPRPPNKRWTDVGALVSGVIDLFGNDAKFSTCAVHVDISTGMSVLVDADQIRQVVWNLVRNAAEAMSTQNQGVRPSQLSVRVRRSGDVVELCFEDNGPGIEPEAQKRIFDPFFTTKEHGSGLGLAITHSIIESHGGRILVESRPGEGTEVTISLPLGEGDARLPKDLFLPSASDADFLGGHFEAPRLGAARGPRS